MDILGFIETQEPVLSWTSAKKLELGDRFCKARGYQELIDDGECGSIPNPQTKKEFMNKDILGYIKLMVNSNIRQEAIDTLIYDEITFD